MKFGQTLGQYRVLEKLGAGGMGVVYRGQDLMLGRYVALKVLAPGTLGNAEAVERFRREARTASCLNHPNICTIYGFSEHDGELVLAMELLEGETLDKRIHGAPMDLHALIDVSTQIAEALDAAHSEGILHRDIKPSNIFLTRRGQVKVLDFGLAKLSPGDRRLRGDDTEARESFLTVAGMTIGTVAYMSPEQARGDSVDARTDLFSFGVVLYEMATGRQSFPGATTAVVFDGILNRTPVPPRTLNASIPEELERTISKALEKDRALRYQTAADIRADLQRLRRDSGSRWVPPLATTDSDLTVVLPRKTAPPPPVGPSAPRRRFVGLTRSQRVAAGAILAVTAGVLSTAAWLTNRNDSSETASESVLAAVSPAVETAPVVEAAPPSVETPISKAPIPAPPPPRPTEKGRPETEVLTVPPGSPVAPAVPTTEAPAKGRGVETETAAAEVLRVARAKMASGLFDPALADLRQLVNDYPTSKAAPEAAWARAELLEKLERFDEAMAAHIEIATRFPADVRTPASKLRHAQLIARSRRPNRDNEVRAVLGRLVTDHPRSNEAFQALLMKIRIEDDRRELRERDPLLGIEVPAVLLSLRALDEQFPTTPATMQGLYRMYQLYGDLNQHERAAGALFELATRFPANTYDAWFKLGELYERRMNDRVRAQDAYARVPQTSSKYRDAQRKLKK